VQVAASRRYTAFRRVSAPSGGDDEAKSFLLSTLTYVQQAARRIAAGDPIDRGPAWSDLQLANESALKAVIQQTTGSYSHTHRLEELLAAAKRHGVVFDVSRFSNWPSYRDISNYRYIQLTPGGLNRLYKAYLLTLDLIVASMAIIKPGLRPGFGVLLNYALWKSTAPDVEPPQDHA
jgi:hypothetical protein